MAVLMEHSQDVKCVAWHPTDEVSPSHPIFLYFALVQAAIDVTSAQILASASYDDTIKLYLDDPSDDWFCATTLTGHTSTVWALAWEPLHGRYLASASDDTTIRLWRRLPGTGELKFECVSVIEGHDRSIYSISWTPAQSSEDQASDTKNLGWLASTGADGSVCVWNITVSSPTDVVVIGHYLLPSHRSVTSKAVLRASSSISLWLASAPLTESST